MMIIFIAKLIMKQLAEEPSVQKQLKYWVMLKKIIGITGIINTEKV